jgi:hypothetical protein
MLKKACALGLLLLVLSPFTAPFQTWNADDPANSSQAAPLELLAAFRDGDLCALVPVRVIASDHLTLAPLSDLAFTSFAVFSAATALPRSPTLTSETGEYSIRNGILRL